MRSYIRALTLVLLLSCSFAAPAKATQIIPRTPQQMGNESSLVVRGTVEEARSFWNSSRTKILTEITIAVDENYKGSAPPRVQILQLGGVVDNVRVTVSGALQWTEGEEVLLFLLPYTKSSYQVAGFSQGKYSVERDGEDLLVRRPMLGGIKFSKLNSVPGADGFSTDEVEEMALQDFLAVALGER